MIPDDQVLAFLLSREKDQGTPPTEPLTLVYTRLKETTWSTPDDPTNSTPKAAAAHWYCPQAPDEIVLKIATYLIYFFAFNRTNIAAEWMDGLEAVTTGCAKCARGFCRARTNFTKKYINRFPAATRVNFERAVDEWQVGRILLALESLEPIQPSSTMSETDIPAIAKRPCILDLPASSLQLLFCRPAGTGVLTHSKIKDQVLDSILETDSPPLPHTGTASAARPEWMSLGACPGLVPLLYAPQVVGGRDDAARRKIQDWAAMAIRACAASTSLTAIEWIELGFDTLWMELIETTGMSQGKTNSGEIAAAAAAAAATTKQVTDIGQERSGEERKIAIRRWRAVMLLLESGGLARDVVEKYVLRQGKQNLVAIVAGSFSSQDPIFPLMLRVFSDVLQISPKANLWTSADPSPEFPLALAADIQQNPLYLQVLRSAWDPTFTVERNLIDLPLPHSGYLQLSKPGPRMEWFVGWLNDYLISLRSLDVRGVVVQSSAERGAFGEGLARATVFMLETLQHRRFDAQFRSKILDAGIKILTSVFIDLGPNRVKIDRMLQAAMLNVLDIHAGTITGVALNRKEYPEGSTWNTTRHTAIEFLYKVFMADGDNIRRILTMMGRQALDARHRKAPSSSDFFPRMLFAEQLWRKTYATASSTDIYGITILMRGMMRFAHLPTPRGNAWGYTDLGFWEADGKWAASITSITHAMKVMKTGFGDKLTNLVAASDAARIKALLDTPRIPEAVIRLLLCSDDDVHDAVIGLVQGIFDEVDERVDCFRAMLLHFPAQTMVALNDYLERWVQDAQSLPTAVEAARWLIRCFTDILEVLCRQSGAGSGLAFLRDPAFLQIETPNGKMSAEISLLWDGMSKALAVIIKRTPKWAPFYDNSEMVDWMQDALIFGRLLVEENRTFEGAVLGTAVSTRESPAIETPSKLSDVGDRIIGRLEQVLDSLTSWLRLTEVETLHQTYELIKSLLDRLTKSRSGANLSEQLLGSFSTVDGFCRRSKRHKTKLNDSQLAELAVLIKPFLKPEEDASEDDVQFISSSKAKAKVEVKKEVKKSDAFKELMRNAERGSIPQSRPGPSSSNRSTPISSPAVIEVDDFDDEGMDDWGGLDEATLAQMEREAVNRSAQQKLQKSQGKRLPVIAGRPSSVTTVSKGSKLPPKPVAPAIKGSGLLSKIRREVAAEHREKVPLVRQLNRGGTLPDTSGPRIFSNVVTPISKPPSEASDSSSESDEEGGLAALKKFQADPKSKLTVVAPRVKLLSAEKRELTTAERQRMNAQRTKARLKPDMTGLWARVLQWDPNERQFEAKLPSRLAGQFKTVEEHVKTYMALYFQELRDQSLNELTESSDPINLTVEIASRQHTDDFIDIELGVVGNLPPMWFVNEYDTCLLTVEGRPTFVKVQGFKRHPKNPSLHIRMHNSRDGPSVAVKSRCQLRKHMNMSTAAREYAALKGLAFYEPELLTSILQARPTQLPDIPQVTWQKAMVAYNVNEPQAKAIIGSMRIKGFALIQGPPGTGKTKTISGLAGRFMTERPTHISLHGSGKTVNAKLLICAPSNAAIDEVTRRLKDGVPTSDGRMIVPRIVRIGAESSMNVSVQDVSLDSLIESQVNAVKTKDGDNDLQMKRVEQALDDIKRKREVKQAALLAVGDDVEKRREIESELATLVQQRIIKSKEINKFRDAARDSSRQLDGARREAREKILQDADIICSTLAGAGHDSIASFQFDTVIIDEAAQSVEPSALIPLKYGCTRCILVGDPQQLPPTVISTKAESVGYNRSLFVRMVENHPEAMHLLSIQYRMHPDISKLPSQVFYGGRLHDGPNMALKTKAPWHMMNVFGTYRFYNVDGREVRAGRQSLKNPSEVEAVVSLYRGLKLKFGGHDGLLGKIGVISPYREQFNELKRTFRQTFGESAFDDIDFGTIDGFQGQEKDIIILTTVRSGDHLSSIGFLKDVRRMNVALTRAKSSLFIVGNSSTLERANDNWSVIVNNARDRGFLIPYRSGMFINPSLMNNATSDAPKPDNSATISPVTDEDLEAAEKLERKRLKREQKAKAKASEQDKMEVDKTELKVSKKEKKRKREHETPDVKLAHVDAPVGSAEVPSLVDERVRPPPPPAPVQPPPLPPPSSSHLPRPPPPPPPPRAPPKKDGALFIKKKKSKYR